MVQVLVFGDVATGWFVIQEREREGEETVMEGERPSCPQPVTFPICHACPSQPPPAQHGHTGSKANHAPAYNASNLWRGLPAIDSLPPKCMVLCHVMGRAYAKPVGVHNECCQTA